MKTKVLIKNIVFLPEIYPRFETDMERIMLFLELMNTGQHFPRLSVVKEHNHYVLLDGKHRLEARKLRGETEAEVVFFNIKKKYWKLAAARFNLQTPQPLSGDELKKVILDAWNSGITNAAEIAEQIGACTDRYVRKIVMPLRDEVRKRRDETIRALNKQGLSQREIAGKLDLSLGTVNNILRCSKTEPVPFLNTGRDGGKEITRSENNFFTPTKVEQTFVLEGRNRNLQTNQPPHLSETPAEEEGSRHEVTGNIFDPNQDFPPIECNDKNFDCFENDLNKIGNEYSPSDFEPESEEEDSKSQNQDEIAKKEPLSCVPDLEKAYGVKFAPEQAHIFQTMELVKTSNKDLVDIAEETGESIRWGRDIMVAAISMSLHNSGEQENGMYKVMRALKMDMEKAQLIRDGLLLQTMLSPVGKHIPDWVKQNLAKKDIELIANLASVKPKDLEYLLRGDKPPKATSRYYKEVPEKIINRLRETRGFFKKLTGKVKNGMFKEQSFVGLLKEYNKFRITINELDDELVKCKRAHF